MNSQTVLTLMQNASLLVVVAIIGDLASNKWKTKNRGLSGFAIGVAIGCIGILVMLTPWRLMPGVVFDTRSILLGISGLFFGFLPTFIAMAMTATLRLIQGGAGAAMGVSVIIVTGSIGAIWGKRLRKSLSLLGCFDLYLFGLVLHAGMIACTVMLPSTIRMRVLGDILLPAALIYPACTLLLGRLLVGRLRREETAAALEASEQRLRLAMGVNSIGFFERDLVTGAVHQSPEWKALLGYAPDELEGVSDAWESRLHPDDRAAALEKAYAWRSGRLSDYESEFRLRHRDGSWRWILARGCLVKDERGRMLKVAGCHIDITRRKADEEAVLAGVRRFRSLAESSSDYIMLYDREGKHIYMNPAGMASADFTEADIIGKTHREANYGASGSENRKSDIEAVFRTGKASSRLVKWEKVKGTVYLDWRLSPVPGPDGDIELVLGISRDITALKTAEHELKKKEELFRALIENAPDGVVLVDREGRFVYISPSARSLLGYSLDEALTFSPDEGTHPEDLPSVLAALDQIIRDPSAVAVREYRFRQKSGGWLWIESRFSNLLDHAGIEALVINFRDISERKRSDDEIRAAHVELRRLLDEAEESRKVLLNMVEDLRRSEERNQNLNAELERRVRDRTAQLQAVNDELESFAYSVSHDLRAPLRAMDGFGSALKREYGGRMDAKALHYIDRIHEGASRMSQLIDDLLGLSRVTRSDFTRCEVDLGHIARKIVAELEAADPERRVDVRIQPGLLVRGDPNLLRIMLENLLGNAWKFTARAKAALIELGSDSQGDRRVYFLRDNGVGFDMAYADKLFAPFHRLHRMDDFPGTGIGLVTVQRIVHRHGGTIWPEAALGRGASFFFTLGDMT